jgi:hypothetical protein
MRFPTLATLGVLLAAATPANSASELPGPEGVPWWKSLAACGGAALRERDFALEANKPENDRAVITNEMNEYLATAVARLVADLGIEKSSAKKSVYRWAGKTWQAMIDDKTPEADIAARISQCKTLLAQAPKVP